MQLVKFQMSSSKLKWSQVSNLGAVVIIFFQLNS